MTTKDIPYSLTPPNKMTDRRLSKGLTYRRLSEMTGVSISHLCEIFLGDKNPSPEVKLKIQQALS